MPDGEKGGFMANQLSLGTHIRCQSLRLRASEMIDNLHGQAGGQSCPKGTVQMCAIRVLTSHMELFV